MLRSVATLSACLLAATCSHASDDIGSIKAALTAQGYTVQDGEYNFFTQDMCDKLSNCYANNPASPYGLVYLPPAPSEDVSTYGGWCEVLCSEDKTKSASYRLNANETVLILGRTPPQSLYFSLTTYMFDRFYPNGWKSPASDIMGKCPPVKTPEGARCNMFASLHNPVNMLTMNTSSETDAWWDSAFAGFMGGDSKALQAVQQVVASAGVPSCTHNTFPIPAGDVRLGTEAKEADGFLSMMRVAFPSDKAAAASYFNNSAFLSVLRITPPQVTQPTDEPFARPELRQRGDDMEDTPTMSHSELNAALTQQLYSGVLSAYGQQNVHHMSYTLKSPTFSDGYDCLRTGIICNGDSMDTTYPNSRVEVLRGELCVKLLNESCPVARRPTLGAEDFYIVTGVNHNATGKSLYSSVVMYDFDRLESVGGFDSSSDSSTYTGSAAQYMHQDESSMAVAPYLYAVKFARSCAQEEQFCTEIPHSGSNSLPAQVAAVFIERLYMDPKYESGPTLDSAVNAVVHHFSPTAFSTEVSPL